MFVRKRYKNVEENRTHDNAVEKRKDPSIVDFNGDSSCIVIYGR